MDNDHRWQRKVKPADNGDKDEVMHNQKYLQSMFCLQEIKTYLPIKAEQIQD